MKLCPHCGTDIERDAVIETGNFVFDPHYGLAVNGTPIRLTVSERIILGTLLKAEGEPVSARALIERLDPDSDDPESLIKVYISKLRRRIGKSRIQCIWGYGYRWAA